MLTSAVTLRLPGANPLDLYFSTAQGAFGCPNPFADMPVKNLSGGNIQKLILARELGCEPKVLTAAQPKGAGWAPARQMAAAKRV